MWKKDAALLTQRVYLSKSRLFVTEVSGIFKVEYLVRVFDGNFSETKA